MGKHLVPVIHNLRQVGKIIVFCGNVDYHNPWASKFTKITLVSADFNEVILECKRQIGEVSKDPRTPEA